MSHGAADHDRSGVSIIDPRPDAHPADVTIEEPRVTSAPSSATGVSSGPRVAHPAVGAEARTSSRPRRWLRHVGSTRLGLIATFLVLLVATGMVATLGIRSTLSLRLDARTSAALRQEIVEVSAFADTGRDPETGEAFDSVATFFDVYMERNVPSLEEAFLTFIGSSVHNDRLRSFPIAIPAEAHAMFAEFSAAGAAGPREMVGRFDTPEGSARFIATRIDVGGTSGVFVVTILPISGLNEIRDLQFFGLLITFGVVLVAAVCAWFFIGRVLSPVRAVTATARTISEPAASVRVRVGGASEAAEMAATVNAMLDRLDSVHETQLEFLRSAGHELRTPLTVVSGHLELLGEGEDDEQEREAVMALVLDELARMGRLVDDLHSLAMAEHPGFLTLEEIDSAVFAYELLGKSTALGRRAWTLDAVDEGTFVGDRHRLTEAVLNLVDNAVKHTSDGDVIALGSTFVGSEVHISVRDTGVGVAIGDHAKVFERFAHGRESARNYRGSGLGLAIVRTIAVAHGGRVEIDSDTGRGSRFRIVIPQGGLDVQNPHR